MVLLFDFVSGLEARGFLFGPMIAQHLNAAFVPIRKKGKLPGECVKVEYALEYGTVSKLISIEQTFVLNVSFFSGKGGL